MLGRRLPACLAAASRASNNLLLQSACKEGNDLHGLVHERGLSSLAANLVPKGAGGRSSVSGVAATVFGATGFLGRYVVQQLAKVGSQVFVPYRGEYDHQRHLKLMGDLGQIVPIKYSLRDEDQVRAAMEKSNVVINLLGRDYETRNFTFEDINVTAAAQIAKLCQEHGGINRFVHVSCLGASPSAPAKLHRTKAAGEAIVRELFPEVTILRPGAMVGTEDRLLNRLAVLAKKFPSVPIVAGGATKLQPAHVVDVAAAVMAVLKDGLTAGLTYELGGPDVFTIRQLVDLMYEQIREHPSIIDIPLPLGKLVTLPREIALKTLGVPVPNPIMFTYDYMNGLEADYVVSPDALQFKDLGIIPRKLHGVAIDHLTAFRAGGPNLGSTVGERVSGAGF
eukprot:TRINITY_DN1004_c0_g1_i1.p1 TRINITY_DN1004_c0_g1~~TRINITY_DN1004_c0_g1_i1.p1  ORF type:complete len:394 (-),score=72.03 TRINITY_DN1004_c0_g1_i1:858-2039(-)